MNQMLNCVRCDLKGLNLTCQYKIIDNLIDVDFCNCPGGFECPYKIKTMIIIKDDE
jgi:hypothetical protein